MTSAEKSWRYRARHFGRQPARVAPSSAAMFGLLGDDELGAAIRKLEGTVAALQPGQGMLAVVLTERYWNLLSAALAEQARRT